MYRTCRTCQANRPDWTARTNRHIVISYHTISWPQHDKKIGSTNEKHMLFIGHALFLLLLFVLLELLNNLETCFVLALTPWTMWLTRLPHHSSCTPFKWCTNSTTTTHLWWKTVSITSKPTLEQIPTGGTIAAKKWLENESTKFQKL